MAEVMTPRDIVTELDKYIIGQADAKRAVAIALRNRYRRMQLPESLRQEVTPKNILMIGPTGVGKTEIARRLSKLANAPFIKVEATKFTEVGFVGREVDSIIRDLMELSYKMVRSQAVERVSGVARRSATKRILDAIVKVHPDVVADPTKAGSVRKEMSVKLDLGELDEEVIEIEISDSSIGVEIMAPPGMEEMTDQLQNMFRSMNSSRTHTKKMKVSKALKVLTDEESSLLLNDEEIRAEALTRTEQHGIVFIDEIDKVCQRGQYSGGGDVSREGVQRDLLPLVEGCTVNTRYGPVKTDHILFIASGAFQLAKPSDLVPELQGRLPIRVELEALTTQDFERILTEPSASLTEQYIALLQTEDVEIVFDTPAIKRIAELAFTLNEQNENIGARRLHTVMERLLEKISFESAENAGKTIKLDVKYVDEELSKIVKDVDLSQYIL